MNQINNSKKIYHAAIYVRLSKEDGDVATAGKRESNSISNQKDLIKNFLKDKKDIVVVSERVDDGYSGSNFERPAFQMMLENISKDYFRHLACGLLRSMIIMTARKGKVRQTKS